MANTRMAGIVGRVNGFMFGLHLREKEIACTLDDARKRRIDSLKKQPKSSNIML